MRTTRGTLFLLVLTLVLPAALAGQQAAPPPVPAAASLDAADVDVQAARDRLHLLLLRPDVRRVARSEDIDLRPLHAGIDRLPASALARLAPYAASVESADAQSAITISTTTIIIVLLILIVVLMID